MTLRTRLSVLNLEARDNPSGPDLVYPYGSTVVVAPTDTSTTATTTPDTTAPTTTTGTIDPALLNSLYGATGQ